ncbi:MAG TPA: hypothetical protein VD902_17495 [Symbiobacteriaceae bacterium]|nr:hypothetical protein [Symbiobacteriaceae bacterium]
MGMIPLRTAFDVGGDVIKITGDTLVSEILEAYPQAAQIFERYGIHVDLECGGVLDNPLDLCETMCGIDDFEGLVRELKALGSA